MPSELLQAMHEGDSGKRSSPAGFLRFAQQTQGANGVRREQALPIEQIQRISPENIHERRRTTLQRGQRSAVATIFN